MSDDTFNRFAAELRRILTELEESLRDGLQSADPGILRRARDQLCALEKELAARGRRVNATVRAHPWESIAIAGVAGFLLGRLALRR